MSPKLYKGTFDKSEYRIDIWRGFVFGVNVTKEGYQAEAVQHLVKKLFYRNKKFSSVWFYDISTIVGYSMPSPF